MRVLEKASLLNPDFDIIKIKNDGIEKYRFVKRQCYVESYKRLKPFSSIDTDHNKQVEVI